MAEDRGSAARAEIPRDVVPAAGRRRVLLDAARPAKPPVTPVSAPPQAAAPGPVTTAPIAAPASAPREAAPARSGPPCVLVVEDEALIRMVTLDTLEMLGFQVAEAGSATEAVKVLASGRSIDAALIDMGLPDRKGDVLVGELRQLNPRLAIIIASGYSADNVRKRVPEDRITKVLPKPYDGRQLEAALKSIGLAAPVPMP